jgi:hypothetical protein
MCVRNFGAVQDEFDVELTRRMRRVDPPEGFAERLMERAETLPSKVVVMRKRPVFRIWAGSAIAAALAMGVFVGEQAHIRSQQRQAEVARQQFETAMRVTDHALDQTRASLQRAGLTLGD